jgi:hypothetical protein
VKGIDGGIEVGNINSRENCTELRPSSSPGNLLGRDHHEYTRVAYDKVMGQCAMLQSEVSLLFCINHLCESDKLIGDNFLLA